MNLARLQDAFQAGILLGGEAILGSVQDTPRLDRFARFQIYVDAYRLRLAEFVANDYPVVRAWMGDERFGSLVEAYIGATLSHEPNARGYSRHLPDFMGRMAPWSEHRKAIDLARFERAVATAFDAPDAPALTIDCLGSIAVEDWPSLVLGFPPSAILLDLTAGTTEMHALLSAGGSPTLASAEGQETILVWRKGPGVVRRAIEADERLAFDEWGRGQTFATLCERMAETHGGEFGPERPAALLATWFEDGLVASVSLGA